MGNVRIFGNKNRETLRDRNERRGELVIKETHGGKTERWFSGGLQRGGKRTSKVKAHPRKAGHLRPHHWDVRPRSHDQKHI